MFPVLALLLFADSGPVTADYAQHTMNFRLVADVPEEKILVDTYQIQTNTDGTRNADVYVTFGAEPPVYNFLRTRFDCQARSMTIREAAAFDIDFRLVAQGAATYPLSIQTGTVGEDLLTFVCGSAEVRMQRPYYGETVREAIRKADPRFR
jgi:hypothetical protein